MSVSELIIEMSVSFKESRTRCAIYVTTFCNYVNCKKFLKIFMNSFINFINIYKRYSIWNI